MTKPLTYAEIDLKALGDNYRHLKEKLTGSAKMAAVIKANAYGHGALQVARVALEAGAAMLIVARLNEALVLREGGIEAPLLILGSIQREEVATAAASHLTLSVNSLQDAQVLSAAAPQKIKVHIKVDSGMGRLGLALNGTPQRLQECFSIIQEISKLPHLEIEGLYTHFASADGEDESFTLQQFSYFSQLVNLLEKNNLRPPLCHCANSAAMLRYPQMHLDLCRLGIIQYGLWPSESVCHTLVNVRPVMSLRSHIIHIKEVEEETPISYGSTWRAPKPSRIATIALGYADGFRRSLSSKGFVLIKGKKAPIVGRVCMDLSMVDVTSIADVQVGDEVVAWGESEGVHLSADEVASWIDTIGYEMCSCVTQRVTRLYKDEK